MGSIYRRAREVEAWTGEEDENIPLVLELVKAAKEYGSIVPAGRTQLVALVNYLDWPYWRRVWVIQELALSRHTMVHCGHQEFSWTYLASVVGSVRDLIDPDAEDPLTPGLNNAENLVKFQLGAAKNEPLRFLEAMKRSFGSLSTDPRDKVFALLGLVYDSGLYVPVPNYKQSTKDVCIGITLSAVATTASLDIVPLLGCGFEGAFPSWIPNWFDLNEDSALRQIEYLQNGLPLNSLNRTCGVSRWYETAAATHLVISMKDDILLAQDVLLDEIDDFCSTREDVTRTPPPPSLKNNPYGTDLGLIQAICTCFDRIDGLHFNEAYARFFSLCFGEDRTLLDELWKIVSEFDSPDPKIRAWLHATGSLRVGHSSIGELANSYFEQLDRSKLAVHKGY
jgi:hypothetical protein